MLKIKYKSSILSITLYNPQIYHTYVVWKSEFFPKNFDDYPM